MSHFDQRFCAWGGLIFTVLFGIGLFVAGWLPLPTPNMSAAEVAAMYQANANGIRTGMAIMVVGGVFYLAFTVVTTQQMRRMEGGTVAPLLQLVTGTINMATFFFGPLIMGAAAFRPDRNPDVLYAMHDIGWLIFIMPFAPATAQSLVVGIATLNDRSPEPVFPRWFGFLSIWCGLLYTPGALTFFFKTGPFAWNGLLTFYIAATAFFLWIVSLVTLLLRAIGRQKVATLSVTT